MYPGSPLILGKMLRDQDRLVCFELHPEDYQSLKTTLEELKKERGGKTPVMEARREDGPGNLKSLLPPPSRRALTLIDPSWEEKSEYETVPDALGKALKRFPQGTFLVWYPLLTVPKITNEKSGTPYTPIEDSLFFLGEGKRCRAELYTNEYRPNKALTESSSPRGMYGSGLVVYNPPWTLQAALEQTLPFLAAVLGGENGGWKLDWEDGS
jgi:23S rRNA (adenine2030-N6)-methyltransferase